MPSSYNSPSIHFNGPVELVQMIFDAAAKEDKRTASTLMSVCRSSKDWAAPVLYENVVLDNRRAAHFADVSSNALRNTKNLNVECMPAIDESSTAMYPSVENLTIANYDLHQLPQLTSNMVRLRKISIKGCMRYAGVVSGAGLGNVTHLSFEDDVPCLDSAFVNELPSLTYFQCKFARSKKTMHEELERCLGIVLSCNKLRKLSIVCSPSDERYARDRIRSWTPDNRISFITNISHQNSHGSIQAY